MINGWGISCEAALRWISLDRSDDEVNTGTGDSLAPSGTKPLLDPMLTQIYVTVWSH